MISTKLTDRCNPAVTEQAKNDWILDSMLVKASSVYCLVYLDFWSSSVIGYSIVYATSFMQVWLIFEIVAIDVDYAREPVLHSTLLHTRAIAQ